MCNTVTTFRANHVRIKRPFRPHPQKSSYLCVPHLSPKRPELLPMRPEDVPKPHYTHFGSNITTIMVLSTRQKKGALCPLNFLYQPIEKPSGLFQVL